VPDLSQISGKKKKEEKAQDQVIKPHFQNKAMDNHDHAWYRVSNLKRPVL